MPGTVAPKKRERATRGGIIQSFMNESEAEQPAARKDEGEPMLYCPRCATRLTELKCKLVCRTCGYYLSCADYY
jgi:hypothetical protein